MAWSARYRMRSRYAIAAALGVAFALAACNEESVSPVPETEAQPQFTTAPLRLKKDRLKLIRALFAMGHATARYHDLDRAIEDGFVLIHECEVRPDGAAGAVYGHPDRIADGRIDPSLPDALLYAPGHRGRPTLVGVELVMPYSLWDEEDPPEFFGVSFQPEDEFQVWGLHVWIWRYNPTGLFEESNPRVSCEE